MPNYKSDFSIIRASQATCSALARVYGERCALFSKAVYMDRRWENVAVRECAETVTEKQC